MRVCMLISSYWPEPEGGAERQCRMLVREFERKGHSCLVLTSRSGRPPTVASAPDRPAGVHRFGWLCPLEKAARRWVSRVVQRTGGAGRQTAQALGFWLLVPVVWMSRLSFLLALLVYAWRRKSSPVDVLHVHESGWLAGAGVLLARRWNIPVLCKEATAPALAPISFGTPGRRRLDRKRREADGWVAQTEAAGEQLIAEGIPADRIRRIPNGVNLPEATASPRDADVVLYVGNLTQGAAWKAFDILFAAWAEVVRARPRARLCFVGAGDSSAWTARLRRDGIDSTVEFAGGVPDPASFYRSAGLFVLPSRVEGLSNALLEAQSWGLPCVVSDIPGNRAVVRDEVNGLVVPVNDVSALATAIIRLLDDPGLRSRLGTAARARMAEEFEMDRVADRVLAFYRILGSRE
jgi:glycosyltransferase involved in cell wall biosynthesis